jgi:flagellar hook-length control protein FliK
MEPDTSSVRHALQKVVERVQELTNKHGGTLKIRLHPENLGFITLTVRCRGEQVDVDVVASRPEVATAMNTHKHLAAESLQTKGLQLGSFSVGHQETPSQGQQHSFSREDYDQIFRLRSSLRSTEAVQPVKPVLARAFAQGSARRVDYWT